MKPNLIKGNLRLVQGQNPYQETMDTRNAIGGLLERQRKVMSKGLEVAANVAANPRNTEAFELQKLIEEVDVEIHDRPCGFGKTMDMIRGFEEGKKYLVVTPLLSEVERILQDSEVPFRQPEVDNDEFETKKASLMALLSAGENIATTHTLYTSIVDVLNETPEMLDGYEIIIDEVLSVLRDVGNHKSLSRKSFYEFYVDTGYATVADNGLVSPTAKWDCEYKDRADTLRKSLYGEAKSGCLYYTDDQFFLWVLPEKIVTSGLKVTIYTFLANGSLMSQWLNKYNVRSLRHKESDELEEFKAILRDHLTIKSIPAIEKLKFSASGQSSQKMNKAQKKTVAQALKNLRARDLKDVSIKDILVTCAKGNWYTDTKRETGGGPFSAGTSMLKANWIANTTRGTNDYKHCSHAIYLWDQHPNPSFLRWLGVTDHTKFSEDYALSELIQWLMRTRLRDARADDRDVTLYLPSPRMRKLLEAFIEA